jgi:hypothetical protein
MSKLPSERTKVVIRGLPPTLSKDAFNDAVGSLIADKHDWQAYYPGKVR